MARLKTARGIWMQVRLPKLYAVIQEDNFTSIATRAYNCVGYAIGDPHWWDPSGTEATVWPSHLPIRDFRIERFLELFQLHGFVLCDNDGPAPEAGHEKIAVFGLNGEFEHVSIQTIDGRWTSKLGELEDISHPLELLTSDLYGEIQHYLKRPGEINRRDGFP